MFTDLLEYPFPHNIWEFIRRLPRNIKNFYQRGMRGYSDEDTWNVDSYISHIAIPMLTRLRDKHAGYPPKLTSKKWFKALDEMIEGFKAYEMLVSLDDIIKDGEYNEEKSDAEMKKFKKGMRLFSKWYFNLWD
jgi:hypothetical protein